MKDIFGKALYDYWKGDHRTPCTIRRDDGYSDVNKLGDYFTRKQFPLEKKVLKYAHGKILDGGCGAGRYILYFQKRGFDVTGIDISPLAVKVCKERGCKKAKVMDLKHPQFPKEKFDTIILFGNNIGICGRLTYLSRLLRRLRKIVKPGGHLLLTSLDVTKTRKKAHLSYHKLNRSRRRYIGDVKIRIEYKSKEGDWFDWLIPGPELLREYASTCGWKTLQIFKEKNGLYSAVLNAITPDDLYTTFGGFRAGMYYFPIRKDEF